LNKKEQILQSQIEYLSEHSAMSVDISCNPSMSLNIRKKAIIRTLRSAGFVKGAQLNAEEQAIQEKEQKRRELSHQQFVCVERLKELTKFERDCKVKREDSDNLHREIEDEIKQINVETAEVESKLAEAKPMVEAAKKLVSGITKSQLNELKSMKAPPAVVVLVMSACCVILGNKVNGWRDTQRVIANPKFVSLVLEFDTMNLTKTLRERSEKYTKEKDFNEERANVASKVAGPLVKWIESQLEYSRLLDIVRPLMKHIKKLKKELAKKQKELSVTAEIVNGLESEIKNARKDINDMVDNMITMQDKYHFEEEPLDE